jgi:hypothetical protein
VATDVVVYPDSRKLMIGGTVLRYEPAEYWDGEE